MIDEKLYQETFSRLRASDRAKEEVFQMKEARTHKKRIPNCLRTAAIAAAMVMALAVTAGAADLATGGALFEGLRQVWSDGYETRYETTDPAGDPVSVTVTAGLAVTPADGRLILSTGGQEFDITDALRDQGAFHTELTVGSRTIVTDVTGDLENWTATETVSGSDGTYTQTISSDDMADEGGVRQSAVVVSEGPGQDGEENVTTVTITPSQG